MNQPSSGSSRVFGICTRALLPCCGAILAGTGNARAHSPIEGIGTFYGYALHPLAVLPHALLLTATALLLGQQERGSARAGVVAMAASFAATLVLAPFRLPVAPAEIVLLFAACLAGILAALRPSLPKSLAGVIGSLAGILIGLDSFPVEAPVSETTMALAGLFAGFSIFLIILAGLAHGTENGWRHVALRVVGSWIAAISLLAMSLELAGRLQGTG
jgi:urease accessory protein